MKKILMLGVVMGMAIGTAALAEDAKPAASPMASAKAAATAAEKKADAKADAMEKKADAKKDDAKAAVKKDEAKAKTEVKKEESKAAAATGNSDWKVEGKTCKTLTNRECAESTEAFAAADGTVYAWTKVQGPKEGGEIHHVWFKGDEQMGDVTLKVGGSPWRTYSKKSLGDKSQGDWRVEVRDANGAVLETLKFSVK